MGARRDSSGAAASRRDLGRRLALLLACLAFGSAVGGAGHWLSGAAHWYAAIPAVLVVAWWFVADPMQCGGVGKP